ncbi:hypothetical protein EJD97_002015 [Solanum chilense]|uniref:Alpha/beta hydrolase fold-3 domain-containing protein n=1 Tax=Solanum chilense TaxID=4083 RepID=A0A6N2CIX5_SOLCI|nr:hypothetical protein EJD97_002015 [Solanum chilense]
MASEDNELVTDFYPHFRIYKNGRVERFYHLQNCFYVPPTHEPDSNTGVYSKDVAINSHVSARLFLPNVTINTNEKLPIIVFYHGGALVLGSAFFNKVYRFLNLLVSESNSIAVAVEYRLTPEHDVYEDCWTALQWVASSQDSWLTSHGDFDKVFLLGESAGANIAFNMIIRADREKLNGDVKINGSILACPYFLIPHENVDVENLLAYKIWREIICPNLESPFDCPMINPLCKTSPNLSVKKSGWNGEFVLHVVEGESHSFLIDNLEAEKARDSIKRFASFIQSK